MAGNGVNVGHGNISISPVLERGFAQQIRQQIQRGLGGTGIEVDASLSQQSIQRMRAQLQSLATGVVITPELDRSSLARIQQQLNGINGTAHVNVDTSRANASLASLRGAFTAAIAVMSAGKLLQVNGALSGLSQQATLYAAAASAAAGATGPLLGAIAGLGAAGLVAGTGLGALAALAVPQFHAIGDAVKASTQAQDANTASTSNVVSAQRSLAAAQRQAAQQRISDAEAIAAAQQNLRQAEQQAAQQQLQDARNIAQAQDQLRAAQEAVNQARRQALVDLRNLSNEQNQNALSVQQAQLDLRRTQIETATTLGQKLRAEDGSLVDPKFFAAGLAQDQARLNLEQAQQRVKDAKTQQADSAAKFAAARRAGVEGSQAVVSALGQERQARLSLTDAQQQQRDDLVSGQQQIIQAQQAVGDAQRQSANNQLNAIDSLASANEALAKAQGGSNTATDAAAAKLAKLTPAQRAAVQATLQFKDALKAQSNAISGPLLGAYVSGLHTITGLLPIVGRVATATGDALRGIFDRAQAGIAAATGPGGGLTKFVDVVTTQIGPVLDGFASILVNIGRTISNVFTAAVPLIQPVLGLFKDLTGSLATASGGFGLRIFFLQILPLLEPLRAAISSVAGAIGALIRAALPLAGPVLVLVRTLGDALRQLFQSANFQAFITNVGSAIQSLTPLLTALVGPIGRVLAVISQQFAALAPMLVPVITQFADVFSQVLVGLSPLLPIFVQLIGILVGFLPILYPIIVAFRDALAPILQAVGQALIAIMPSVQAVVQAFVPLLPLFGQLVAAIVPVITALVVGLAPVLAAILQAMQPLLPIIIQFAQQLGGALVQALGILLPALVPLIPPLGQLLQAFLQLFLAALQPMIPLLPVFAQLLASLVPVLIPLVQAFTWLVNFIRPIAPLLLGLVSPFFLIVGAITLLVQFWTWAFNTIIFPILQAAAPLFIWVFRTIIAPALDAVRVAMGALGTAYAWVWNTLILPVLNAFWAVAKFVGAVVLAVLISPLILGWQLLSTVFRDQWNFVLHPVFNAVAAVAGWLWNVVLKPIFAGIQFGWGVLLGAMKWAWDNILHPVLFGISLAVGQVKNAFDAAIRGIKATWDKLSEIFKAPVRIVIDVIDGFDGAVNWILDKVGIKDALPRKGHGLPVFAEGGPVYGPGTETSDSILARLSNNEHVTNAQSAMQNRDLLSWMDANPGVRLPGFSIGGWVKSGLSAVTPDFVGGAIHAVGDAAGWVADAIAGTLRAGAADALGATYKAISGPLFGLLPHNLAGDMPRMTADSVVGNVLDWIRGKEEVVGDFSGADGTSAPLIVEYLRAHGIQPGAVTTTGGKHANGSYHYKGMAVDFGNASNPNQRGIFNVFDAVSGSLLELFWDPAGHYVKNGRRIPGAIGGHGDHVHVAATMDAMNRLLGRGSTGPAGEGSIVQAVHSAASARGWGGMLGALDQIISHESSWNPRAKNPSSTAYGLFQMLTERSSDVGTQISHGLGYIAQRYGNPNNAWNFWQRHHWYDDGGWLMPGATAAFNGTGKPEAIFTQPQLQALLNGGSGGRSAPVVNIENYRPTERTDVDHLARRLSWLERTESGAV